MLSLAPLAELDTHITAPAKDDCGIEIYDGDGISQNELVRQDVAAQVVKLLACTSLLGGLWREGWGEEGSPVRSLHMQTSKRLGHI